MAGKNPWDNEQEDVGSTNESVFRKVSKISKHSSKFVYGLLLFIVMAFLSSGLFRVDYDQKGVILRFGKWVRTVGPGLQYKLPYPFEQAILCRVTAVNQIDIGANSEKSENLVLTGDSNLASFSYSVLWKIKEDEVESFLFNAKRPEATVIAVSESVMREIIGQSDFAFVQTEGRETIQKKALASIQAIMDEYKLGVEIVKVSLQRVEPPASVIDAFRDVERAQADQQSERNKAEAYARDTIARTRGFVAEKINNAEAEKAKIIAKAQGDVERFDSVYASYKLNPDIIARIMTLDTFNAIYSNANKLIVDKNVQSLQHMSIPQSYLTPTKLIGDAK